MLSSRDCLEMCGVAGWEYVKRWVWTILAVTIIAVSHEDRNEHARHRLSC